MILGRFDVGGPRSDLDALGGSDIRREGDSSVLRAPGIDIRVSGESAQLACEAGCIVAVEGRPRFKDVDCLRAVESGGPVAGWLRVMKELESNGARYFNQIGGEFAVALIDLRARSGWLASDRFAVRSISYAFERGQLRFGTRADEVAKLGTADIDLQSLYDYLYFHMIPSPRTVFAGVRRVPGGHSLRATLAGPMLSRYWVPAFDASVGKRSLASLKEEFVTLLRQATEREANDGGPVGAFLSGGTDSSTVVGMLQSVTGTAPEAYSIGFDAEGYDEMEYARLSARHFGARHHEFYIAPADLVRSIPEVARSYDQPFGNSSALPTYYCAKIARGDGIRKMLAGDGGDELFGGNTRYVKQGVFELYHGLPRALRVHLLEPILVNADWPTKLPLVQKLASYVRQARVEMPARMNTYNLLERLGVDAVLESGFLRGVDPADPAAQQRREYAGVKGEFINRMLGYDWKYTLAENDLPKVCGMTSLAGVAVGFPLLDEDIVDFSLRLPVQLKVRGLRLRYFFKEALRGFLPEATLTKKKHGFGLPFGPWLVRDASLRELARDSLHALGRRGLVRRAFVEDLLDHRIVEHPGYYGEMVWILMMLEQWLGAHAPGLSLDVGTAERDRVPTRQALAQ